MLHEIQYFSFGVVNKNYIGILYQIVKPHKSTVFLKWKSSGVTSSMTTPRQNFWQSICLIVVVDQ